LFEDELKAFERQYTEVSVKGLLDNQTQLPGDIPFVQNVNQLKQNLLTTARTWGCIHGLKSEKIFFSLEINVTF
jgi:hypothetical protein